MKTCPKCQRTLPLSAFGVRVNGKPQYWCRACHCAYTREHYQKNKDYYYALQDERVKRHRNRIREAKSAPCADCGRRYLYYVMDFDHRPGRKSVSTCPRRTSRRDCVGRSSRRKSPNAMLFVPIATASGPTSGGSTPSDSRRRRRRRNEDNAAVAQW